MSQVITGGATRLKTVAIDVVHSLVGAWVGATLMVLLFAVPGMLSRGDGGGAIGVTNAPYAGYLPIDEESSLQLAEDLPIDRV